MSEKYTIKENKHDAILFDVFDNTGCLRASFKSEILAQEYISLLNYNEKRKSAPNKIKFKQIQCVSVPNTEYTQCNVFMYGLDEDGVLWFKRECDFKWLKEPLEC